MAVFTLELDSVHSARLRDLAAGENRSAHELLTALVDEAIDSRLGLDEQLDRLYAIHRERLASDGVADLSREELLNRLRASRAQIADELYP